MATLIDWYSRVLVRTIWFLLVITRPFRHPDTGRPELNVLYRDYEWTARHECENCGSRCKHRYVEWLPERVVTATCSECGFEGTL